MKKRYSILLFLLFSILLSGCTSQSVEKPDQMLKLIDDAVKITEKSINEKDLKLARTVWTQISEYGVKATELDKKELADSLGKLASTYVYLVAYIETGEELQLTTFRSCFGQAVSQLKQYVMTQQGSKLDKQ